MARLYSKVLGIVDSTSTANKDVFTVPAGHLYIVRTMLVTVHAGVPITVKFYDTARNPYFWAAVCTVVDVPVQFEGRWVWEAGQNMAFTPGTANRVGVWCSGYDLLVP